MGPALSRARRSSGFLGKLPARGDFVTAEIGRAAARTWETWTAHVLVALDALPADRRRVLWRTAPVWRFALPATMCGPDPLLGLWLPSIDTVGRHYPLLIAVPCPGGTPDRMARRGTAWLDAAEDAGRAAIADDLAPEDLRSRLPPPPDLDVAPDADLPHGMAPLPGSALWWTEGSPRLPPQARVLDAMPDPATFMAMLDAGSAAAC